MTDSVATGADAGTTVSSTSAALAAGAAATTATGDVAAQVQAAAAAAQGNAPAADAPAWLTGATAEQVGYVQNKGWTDPKQVLEGYQNLEKLRGVPAERLLTLPAADADDAAKGAFYEKLGRPKDVAGYEFKLGEGDSAFDAGLKQSFFKHGISADAAKGVIADYAAIAQGQLDAQAQTRLEKVGAEHQELLREWGAAAQQNMEAAKKGRELLKFSDSDVDALGEAIGHKRALQLLHDVANRSGEARFVTDSSAQGYGQAMTPGQAEARLAELSADPAWRAKILANDTNAVAERRRLIGFKVAGQ